LQANKEYKNGNFEKAFELYKRIPSKGFRIYYNMGNAAFKQEKYGLALLYWRRAERLWGMKDKAELFYNISLLKQKLFGKQQRTPFWETFKTVRDYSASFIRSVHLIVFQVLFLITWFFIFFSIKYFYRKRYRVLIVLLFTLTALSGTVLITKYMYLAHMRGVVVSKKADLLSGPDESFPVIGKVLEAQEVAIKKEMPLYFKIKIGNIIGWVQRGVVKKV